VVIRKLICIEILRGVLIVTNKPIRFSGSRNMDDANIEKSIHVFCSYMSISEVEFRNRPIANQEELKDQIVTVFKEHPIIFGKFLFAIFDSKTRDALSKNVRFGNALEGLTPLNEIFKKSNIRTNFEKLESNTGLVYPTLVVPTYKYLIQLSLFVTPIIILGIIILNNIDFFVGNYLLLKWGFITPIIFLPYIAFDILFPNFFKPSSLPRDMSYGELISELVILNRQNYIDNNWEITYSEIPSFLKNITVSKTI
jgi:hypothetical protein